MEDEFIIIVLLFLSGFIVVFSITKSKQMEGEKIVNVKFLEPLHKGANLHVSVEYADGSKQMIYRIYSTYYFNNSHNPIPFKMEKEIDRFERMYLSSEKRNEKIVGIIEKKYRSL